MATLVLTAVGTAIGGPIGGALGGLLGQTVDRELLFKPKGRQGPRLTELKVQTSSYGSAIPRLFGTMRVAGTVIWATDFVESAHESGGGKGRPSQTSYSYSVSFAVLLSARRIRSVRRIWADGKLLRGAAGDFKTRTGFRLHPGDEDQPPDPGMVAAIGASDTPAHRGCAYAVFEQFELAEYGNRIPSLTFEVIADEGPVSAGAIAEDISDGLVEGSGATQAIDGFSAYGDSMRGVLETLAVASGGWFAPAGDAIRFTSDGVPVREVEDRGMAAGEDGGAIGTRAIATIDSVPKSVMLAHYDPARDYQTGLQRVRRPGAGAREQRIEMPAALSGAAAKTMAAAALARAETARTRRSPTFGWDAADLQPGDVVRIAGEPGRWRIGGWSLEAMVLTLELVRLAAAPIPASADSGTGLPAPDLLNGPTIVHAFELPALDDAVLASPRLLIAAGSAAPGWRGAALLYSTDDGGRWISAGNARRAATIGTLATLPETAPATLIDRRSAFEVILADPQQGLVNADAGLIDGGANLALVGDELLQFGRAEQIDAARWRLSELWRARRGTEAAIGAQAAGDRFVLLTRDTITAVDLPPASLGATVRVLASGAGDIDAPAAAETVVTGRSVLPPSPVHFQADRGADGALRLRWIRRSRAGWRWLDGVDAPLAEEREAYRLSIDAGGVRRDDDDRDRTARHHLHRGGSAVCGQHRLASPGRHRRHLAGGFAQPSITDEDMMTDETSARLGLPLLQPGQAQKEMTHNEALALLDLVVGARVLDIGVETPPSAPAIGECWIVGTAPSGDWNGHAGALAGWTAGGWRFAVPVEGMTVWVDAAGLPARYLSGAWHVGELKTTRILIDGIQVIGAQAAGIDDPAGGTTVDSECRAALTEVLEALRMHGLIGG